MRESGWTIYKKVREQRCGQIRALIRELIRPA